MRTAAASPRRARLRQRVYLKLAEGRLRIASGVEHSVANELAGMGLCIAKLIDSVPIDGYRLLSPVIGDGKHIGR